MTRLIPIVVVAAVAATFPAMLALGGEPETAGKLDLAKVDRSLAKEPAYVAEPRYALFVFGHTGATRVWAVADKSRPDAPRYDVLYWDRNANGDLTEAGEHFTRGEAGKIVPFPLASVGDVREKDRGIVHTGIEIDCANPDDVYVGLRVAGKYPALANHDANGILAFGRTRAEAPVLNPGGPVTLALGEPLVIDRELKNRIYVAAGSVGLGDGTFVGFRNDLLARGVTPSAAMRFEGGAEGSHRVRVPLDYRCCETLFSGPFSVPAGASRLTVSLETPSHESLQIEPREFSRPIP